MPTAALESTAWMAVGFEIIDCPFPDWKFQPSDFVASYGLHAALVVGERLQVRPDLIGKLVDELPRFKARVSKSGGLVEEGSGQKLFEEPRFVSGRTRRSRGEAFSSPAPWRW